jgi:hypothetical protein
MATAFLTFTTDIPARDEAAFNRWYDHEHMHERMAVKGFRWAARYVAQRGSPKYLAVYETSSTAVLRSKAYLDLLQAPSPMTRRIMQRVRNGQRRVFRQVEKLGEGHGAAAMTIDFSGSGERLDAALSGRVLPALAKAPGIVRAQLWQVDPDLSDVETEERRIRGDGATAPGYRLFIEATTMDDLRRAAARHASDAALRKLTVTTPRRRTWRLMQLLTAQSFKS